VLVVGGGDSAVEAAVALADAGARVMISYRGKSFNRAAPKNKQTIEAYAAQQRLKAKYGSQVVAFEPEAVILQLDDGSQKRYANHGAFVLIGADPPVTWLEKLGVRFVLRPHQYSLGKTDDFVRRLLGERGECPEDAAQAAQAVTGRPRRRWRRAAIGCRRRSSARWRPWRCRTRRAAPRSGCAPRPACSRPARRSSSRSRCRSSPSASARPRRGRRDAVGRRAHPRAAHAARRGRPPRRRGVAGVVRRPGGAARAGAPSHDDTPPPVARPRVKPPAAAPQVDDIVAKPAVIVGLAKATAAGPRTRSGAPTRSSSGRACG
jgi:hypothetical protein